MLLQVAKYCPEEGKLATNSLENMGVKELQEYLRKCNAARNRGELNEQFREWILDKEAEYTAKIADIYKVGNHKVQLAYYGMVYTILKWTGCYLCGKKNSPIGITRNRYCTELSITDRLKSNNARKALADCFYGHNYFLRIASKANNERVVSTLPVLDALEAVFTSLADEIKENFLD